MGPLFVILFDLIAAAIFGAFWLTALIIFIIGRRKKVRPMTWLGGIPLIGLTLIAFTVIGLIGYSFVRSQNPQSVYEDTFQEPPSADVTEIQSDSWSFADSGHVYLRFQASDQTFQHILPKQLVRVSYEQYMRRMPGTNLSPPEWWIQPSETTSEIYLLNDSGSGGGKRFATETTLMTYDERTTTVEYFYMGID
ncbi:MAG: hypothetical protein ACYCXU_09485 [Thermoleophilia bacterium]